MTDRRESPGVEPVRTFDAELTGNIILDPCLARDGQALFDDVQRTRIQMLEVPAGGTEKQEAFCMNISGSAAQWCLPLSRLKVFGLDFELFDPRKLYPSANRMSFVFLESPDLPSLDGCLAQIETREQCRPYGSELIREADWYSSPLRTSICGTTSKTGPTSSWER